VLALAVTAAALIGGGTVIGISVDDHNAKARTIVIFRPPPRNSLPSGPPPLGPASAVSVRHPGRPGIAMSQTFGDGYTDFVVQGRGWVPGRRVTIRLAGEGVSPVHPVIDSAGTFSYTINQDHEFFRGKLPPGHYRVIITARGGERAAATFVVNHL
jgi:hypothetical protein